MALGFQDAHDFGKCFSLIRNQIDYTVGDHHIIMILRQGHHLNIAFNKCNV
jgi:hypothetical protein